MTTRWISSGRAKRAIDLMLAIPALVVLAPVSAVVACLVRLRLGSPVLFRQERAGRDAAPIRVPKFRSMTDARGPDGELLPDADRLTPFGVLLRSTSLDELPQLWTVVKGDMSLVGPRPLPMVYVDRYSERQRRRLDARPGITGWAQVNGRNATSWPERLEHDVWYVEHASPRVDLRILVLTVRTALRRDGVAAEGHVTMREFMGET
ncbi:sugar transferase [Ilumatobacter sp.]|uniref:sugar transferase n=1 Tax=Ilumatobacter sp. TaxID=1967498 RepID=UPI003AF87B28